MPRSLIWSAVNISEGRRMEALSALADSLGQAGLQLADWSADADHNRSVFSLIGDQTDLLAGLRQIFKWATENIDLRGHEGRHPRLGAVDVVPFAPLGSTGIDEARQVGLHCARAIAEEFGVPIILYRESSTQMGVPITLPFLRQGGLLKLTERLQAGELTCDFGPPTPHPRLGVSVFGARPGLVAYNCVLATTDLDLGRTIADQVRERNSGLAGLQAMAFPLEQRQGRIQISMNLLTPNQTPPHLAFLKVSEEAERRGTEVISSELIGLVPEEALRAAFQHFLKLESFRPGQVAWDNMTKGEQTL